jgi:hypothetical protein
MSAIFDIKQVKALPAEIQAAIRGAFPPTAQAGVPLLQAEIPVRGGALRSGVKVQPQGSTEAGYEVSATSPEGFDYAEPIATGRKGFRARPGHALRIPVENLSGRIPLNARDGYIFVKSVGPAPPNPYPERAADTMEAVLPERFGEEMEARF